MKVKVSSAEGPVLNWMVSKCEGIYVNIDNIYDSPKSNGFVLRCGQDDGDEEYLYEPSTSWAQGGPIIEREKLCLDNSDVGKKDHLWFARIFVTQKGSGWDAKGFSASGPTPLVAAMRCYVVSRLGEEVEIPEELL